MNYKKQLTPFFNTIHLYLSHSRASRYIVMLICAYIFCALLHPSFFIDAPFLGIVVSQIYGIGLAFTFIYTCASVRYIGIVLYYIVCLTSSLLAYAKSEFGYTLSADLIYGLLQTTPSEVAGVMNLYLVTWIITMILILTIIYIAFRYLIFITSPNRKIVGLNSITSFIIFCIIYNFPTFVFHIVPWGNKDIPKNIVTHIAPNSMRWMPFFIFPNSRPPYEDLTEMYQRPYFDFKVILHLIKNYHNMEIILDDSSQYNSSLAFDEEITCVLVFGESTRIDHFGLYNLGRDTTPRLSKIDNIHKFTNMYSYGASTELSFRGILTGLIENNEQVSRTSFVSILRKHGFHCSYYIENGGDMSTSRMGEQILGQYLNERESIGGSIETVSNTIIEKISAQHAKRKFVFIQNKTGHYPYDFDPKYAVYRPSKQEDGYNDKAKIGMINDYDNCMIAVDSFLANIIEYLRNNNAVLLYVSDHSQLLGDNGKWAHGDPSNPILRHVPAFVWFSDTYRKNHPELTKSIQQIVEKPLVHGQFFPTILKLCGVNSCIPLKIGDFVEDDVRKHANNLPPEIKKEIVATP